MVTHPHIECYVNKLNSKISIHQTQQLMDDGRLPEKQKKQVKHWQVYSTKWRLRRTRLNWIDTVIHVLCSKALCMTVDLCDNIQQMQEAGNMFHTCTQCLPQNQSIKRINWNGLTPEWSQRWQQLLRPPEKLLIDWTQDLKKIVMCCSTNAAAHCAC